MTKLPILLTLVSSLFFCSCGSNNRQEIDLSDRTTEQPADGIGHYLYALSLPESIAPGEKLEIQMDWRTVGPADGRKRYAMEVLLDGPSPQEFYVGASANTVGEINLVNWLNHYFPLPNDMETGTYTIAVRLRGPHPEDIVVPLGFTEEMAMKDGYYGVAEINVTE